MAALFLKASLMHIFFMFCYSTIMKNKRAYWRFHFLGISLCMVYSTWKMSGSGIWEKHSLAPTFPPRPQWLASFENGAHFGTTRVMTWTHVALESWKCQLEEPHLTCTLTGANWRTANGASFRPFATNTILKYHRFCIFKAMTFFLSSYLMETETAGSVSIWFHLIQTFISIYNSWICPIYKSAWRSFWL